VTHDPSQQIYLKKKVYVSQFFAFFQSVFRLLLQENEIEDKLIVVFYQTRNNRKQ